MASRQATADFILEQIAAAGTVRAARMFGGFSVYCDGKVVALICDDQLYVKPTAAGRTFLGPWPETPPCPGIGPYLLVTGDQWDNSDWLAALVRITAAALPPPKPKRPKRAIRHERAV
jgi:hypothetical protein